uniref:blood vessel epicardial substance isoform X2 n=1 Tax=Myxine glutinosa TaxID=7769 RepID=UPI00358DED67
MAVQWKYQEAAIYGSRCSIFGSLCQAVRSCAKLCQAVRSYSRGENGTSCETMTSAWTNSTLMWASDSTTNSSLGNSTSQCSPKLQGQSGIWYGGEACLLFALLIPQTLRFHPQIFKTSLGAGFVVLAVWGAVNRCAIDVLVWHVTIAFLCLIQIAFFVYEQTLQIFRVPAVLRPIYKTHFAPLGFTPRMFRRLVGGPSRLHNLPQNQPYAIEEITPAGNSLSLLVRGRLRVSHNGEVLHTIWPGEFVDSPEFRACQIHPRQPFQVSVVAEEDSVLLGWPQGALHIIISSKVKLGCLLLLLVGQDVMHKLCSLRNPTSKNPARSRLTQQISVTSVRSSLASTSDMDEGLLTPTGLMRQASYMEPIAETMEDFVFHAASPKAE